EPARTRRRMARARSISRSLRRKAWWSGRRTSSAASTGPVPAAWRWHSIACAAISTACRYTSRSISSGPEGHRRTEGMTGEERLLEGVRVLDVASYIAAPAAAMMLADLGAEVIKVEPPGGDAYRDLRNAPGMPRTETDYGWLVDNRNKKGIVIDLKSEAGRGVLYRLAETADVFITNLPLNVRSRLGVTWEDIAPLNDRLIYASLTAYGEAGEEASKTGFDSTAWWARSGLMDLVRPSPDAAPTRSLPGMGDHPTA